MHLESALLQCSERLLSRDLCDAKLVLDADGEGEVYACEGLGGEVLDAFATPTSLESLVSGIPDESLRHEAKRAMEPIVLHYVSVGWLTPTPLNESASLPSVWPRAHVVTPQQLALLPSPSDGEDNAWAQYVEWNRLTPLAVRAAEEGLLDLDDETLADLSRLHRQAMGRALLIERSAVNLARSLAQMDVRFAILKGVATAHLDYADPAMRQFGDVDVLVHSADIGIVDDLLSDQARAIEPLLTKDRLMPKARVFTDRFGIDIDVHHRLLEDPYGRFVPVDDLLDHREPFRLAGVELFALDAPRRLAHAIGHAATSPAQVRRGSAWLDVAMLAQSSQCSLTATELLGKWSLGCLVAPIDEILPGLLGQPVNRSDALSRLFQRALKGSARSAELATVIGLRSPRQIGRHLSQRLKASEELRRLGGESPVQRLRRALLTDRRGGARP